MLRISIIIAALLALLALSACGGDDDGEGQDIATTGDVERYCELSAELDRAGEAAFGELERDPNATPEEFRAAERELVEGQEAEIQELQDAAPAEIVEDVETLSDALRARAGLGPQVDEAEAAAAERRVQEFEKRSC
jgi:hypothetical protein